MPQTQRSTASISLVLRPHAHYDFSLYASTTDKSMKQHVIAVLKAIFIIILKEKRSPLLSKLEAICQREAVRRLSGLGQRCLQSVCLSVLSPVTDFLVCTFVLGAQTGHCWEWVPMDSLCLSATLSIFFLVYGFFLMSRLF